MHAIIRFLCSMELFIINPYSLYAAEATQQIPEGTAVKFLDRSADINVAGLTLNQALLVHHPEIQQFIADKLRGNKLFQDLFFDIIQSSRDDRLGKTVAIAATNAATILNAANVSFSHDGPSKDLSGVQIPGANLSQGVFDGTKFCNADLTGVKFQGSWLDNADFSGAMMENVDFDERAYLEFSKIPRACCYSKIKNEILVVSEKSIFLYDVRTLKQIEEFKGHRDQINSVALHPSKQQFISGGHDQKICLWDYPFTQDPQTFEGHEAYVTSVAFSFDGKIIASGSGDKTLRIWDIKFSKALKKFEHPDEVTSIAFCPTEDYIVSGTEKKVYLWNYTQSTREPIRIFNGHADHVTSVAFSFDGQEIASGSKDKTICLWNSKTGKKLHRSEGHTENVKKIVFRPEMEARQDKQLISCGDDKTICLWDCKTGNILKIFDGHTDTVQAIAFDTTGNQIFSCGDRTLRFWNCSMDRLFKTFEGHTDEVNVVTCIPLPNRTNMNYVFSGGNDNVICIWDSITGNKLKNFDGHMKSITSLACNPKGQFIVIGGAPITTRDNKDKRTSFLVLNYQTGEVIKFSENQFCKVYSVGCSPVGEHIISAGADNDIYLWNISNGILKKLIGHSATITSIAFNSNGQNIASGSCRDQTICLWTLSSPTALLKKTVGQVKHVVFHPIKKQIVYGTESGKLGFWNYEHDEPLKILIAHNAQINSIAFSPSGAEMIATCSDDKTIRLWTWNGEILAQISLCYPIRSVCWSNTQEIVTGGHKSVCYWKILREQNQQFSFQLLWSSYQSNLSTKNMKIDTAAQRLSQENSELLKQRSIQAPTVQERNFSLTVMRSRQKNESRCVVA